MLRIAADALSVAIRTVSVDFRGIRSPILKVISCFTDAADKVSPYWLRDSAGIRTLLPTKTWTILIKLEHKCRE